VKSQQYAITHLSVIRLNARPAFVSYEQGITRSIEQRTLRASLIAKEKQYAYSDQPKPVHGAPLRHVDKL